VHGLDEALRRGELYLKAGADGLFIEAPQTVAELERVGRTFQGVPQLANMVEGGGMTPVMPPAELYRLGFAMVAYPVSLIFRVARTIEKALADLHAGTLALDNEGVDFTGFKEITNYPRWAALEQDAAGSAVPQHEIASS
jgi:2-methylisocitrate lyase-like PEP mutase family enzyme